MDGSRGNGMVRFFIQRFVFSISIFAALVLFGLIAARQLGVNLLPEAEFPVVAVVTSYAGAGPEEVARQVSEPIEDALTTLPGVDEILSTSREGVSQVVIIYAFGTNVEQAAVDVAQRVNAIRGSLPDGIGTPIVQKFDPTEQPILSIALSAPGMDLLTVQRYAEDTLAARLQRLDGVADVGVSGGPKRELQVLLDPGRLEAYGMNPRQVAQAISASSLNLPAGSVDTELARLLFSVRSTPATPGEVERMLVDSNRGLRVQDVATVRETVAAPTSYARLNGQPVITLDVRQQSGANAVATAEGVRRALANTTLPEGYRADIIGDSTTFIQVTVSDTFREAFQAILAVAFIVLLFLGKLGSVFSVVLAIPITLLGAMVLFGLLGFTFNIISLLALIVAVGIVVDDSIVIAENTDRYRDMGYSRKDAAIMGASEVVSAVGASTLSLLAVFLPIAFLPGIVGQYFREFGLGLAAAVSVSWLEAMFFLTVRMAYLPDPLPPDWQAFRGTLGLARRDLRWVMRSLRQPWFWLVATGVAALVTWQFGLLFLPLVLVLPALLLLGRYLVRLAITFVGAITNSLYRGGEWLTAYLRERYAWLLARVLKHSAWVLGGTLLVSLASLAIVSSVPFNFIPRFDTGQFQARLTMPTGTPLDRTNAAATLLERELLAIPEVRYVSTSVGGSNSARANFVVEIAPKRERTREQDAIMLEAERRFALALAPYPDARAEVRSESVGGVTSNLELNLSSGNLSLLSERNELALEILRQNPNLRNPRSAFEQVISERVLEVDLARLSGTGLTPSDLAQTLRTYNVGSEAAQLRAGDGEETPIIVKLDPRYTASETALLSLPIYAPSLRSSLPLRELGAFIPREVPAAVTRSNQAYSASLEAEMAPGAPGTLQVRREVEEALMAAGVIDDQVTFQTSGSANLLDDLMDFGPIAFGLALVLNYLVIASQFNSFRYPLYLLMPVPLALVGAIWLIYLSGVGLDVVSVLGMVMLIGLVTKNAILLLDFAVKKAEELPLYEALLEAAKLRLRPILMTTVTILIIGLPLVFGIGEGGEFRRPLGIVILGGVTFSALLTLFVVPAAFYLFERKRYEKRHLEELEQAVLEEPAPVSVS